MTQHVEATAERDFIARATFSDLEPGTVYKCETRIGLAEKGAAFHPGPTAEFKTLPGPGKDDPAFFGAACR